MKSINLTEKEISIIYESLIYYAEEAESMEDDAYNEEVNNLINKIIDY